MALSPFERIDARPLFEQFLLTLSCDLLGLALLLFIHRLGHEQLFYAERGIKWLVVVIQIQHARAKDHRNHERHHSMAICDIVVWRQWEREKFLLYLVQVEQVFEMIRL